ncbi:MAG: hypothetical protein MI743_13200 [Sneathiellales bacterium]|nr:hypothetical protein [Sneathiellales bacterium]
MATHGAIAFIVQKNDTKIRIRHVGFYQQGAIHVSVSPGLIHQETAKMIRFLLEIASLFEQCKACWKGDALCDYSKRLAPCMHLDSSDRAHLEILLEVQ